MIFGGLPRLAAPKKESGARSCARTVPGARPTVGPVEGTLAAVNALRGLPAAAGEVFQGYAIRGCDRGLCSPSRLNFTLEHTPI